MKPIQKSQLKKVAITLLRPQRKKEFVFKFFCLFILAVWAISPFGVFAVSPAPAENDSQIVEDSAIANDRNENSGSNNSLDDLAEPFISSESQNNIVSLVPGSSPAVTSIIEPPVLASTNTSTVAQPTDISTILDNTNTGSSEAVQPQTEQEPVVENLATPSSTSTTVKQNAPASETDVFSTTSDLTLLDVCQEDPSATSTENVNKDSYEYLSSGAVLASLPKNLFDPLLLAQNNTASAVLQMLISEVNVAASSTQEKGMVTYSEAFANTDLQYELKGNTLKENIILKNRDHPQNFKYTLNAKTYDYKFSGNKIILYKKGRIGNDLYKLFTISAPKMSDASSNTSENIALTLENDILTLTPDSGWLSSAVYPVIVDPTIEVEVLNIHSHPVQGEYWNVDFVTQGTADLTITPADQATIDDMQFTTLFCGSEDRTNSAQLDPITHIISYPNWSCDDIATVTHLDLKTGNHHLVFQFSDATETATSSEAFNTAPFTYSRTITVDHTQVPNTDQVDYPLLVYVSDNTLKDVGHLGHVQSATGADIIFFSDAGLTTQLPSLIESYDNVNGVLWARVKVTLSYTEDTVIYMGYGNATPPARTTSWFDSTTSVFVGGGGKTINGQDLTGQNLAGGVGTVSHVAGKVAGGASIPYDAWNNDIYFNSTAYTQVSQKLTLSLWVYQTDMNTNGPNLILKRNNGNPALEYNYGTYIDPATGKLHFQFNDGSYRDFAANSAVGLSAWHHLAVVVDETAVTNKITFYRDGQPDGTPAYAGTMPSSGGGNVWIGNYGYDRGQYRIHGSFDEARIIKGARSGDWIAVEYANENAPSSFAEVGTEQPLLSPAVPGPFTYLRSVTVNHALVPNTNQTDFPLLVHFTDIGLKDVAHSGHVQSSSGNDILFFSDAGLTTQIPSVIEGYLPATGELWARVKTNVSYTADTVIYMGYGNTSPPSRNVMWYDAGLLAMWDMGFDGWNAWSARDLTGRHATFMSGSFQPRLGQVGGGNCPCSGYQGVYSSNTEDLKISQKITLSAWIHYDSPNDHNTAIIVKRYTTLPVDPGYNYGFWIDRTNDKPFFQFYDGSTHTFYANTALTRGAWNHVAVTVDETAAAKIAFYLNGVPDGTPAYTGTMDASGNWDVDVATWFMWDGNYYLGGGSNLTTYNSSDELRLSSVARSGDWVAAEYNNELNPAAFATLSAELVPPDAPTLLGPANLINGSWTTDNTPTLNLTLSDSDGTETIQYKIQIDDTADFSSPVVDYTSVLAAPSATSFTVGQAAGGGTYTVGAQNQTLSDSSSGYYWRVLATDNSGASSAYSTANSGAVAFKVDATAPTAGSLSVAVISSSSLTPSISGASDATSNLSATPYIFYNSTASTNSGATANTSWLSESLNSNTQYSFYTQVSDTAGNTANTASASKYTLANIPGAPILSGATLSTLSLANDANSNPTSPATKFAVQITSASPADGTWLNKWVDGSGNPSAAEVWLTDAQLDGLVITGLQVGTTYEVKSKARNEDTTETALSSAGSGTTLADTTAPSPDPMTFALVPAPDSSVQISMAATTATDATTPPVEYLFGYFDCALNGGTGGSSSIWQSSTLFTDSGLQPNKCYGYKVQARDSVATPNETASSSQAEIYTLANTPATLAISSDSTVQLTASWSANNNPDGTEYLVTNITASTTSGWITATSSSFTGLTCNTAYSFNVKAKNGNDVETATTSAVSQTTAACPSTITPSSGGGGGGWGVTPQFVFPLTETPGVIFPIMFPFVNVPPVIFTPTKPAIEILTESPISESTTTSPKQISPPTPAFTSTPALTPTIAGIGQEITGQIIATINNVSESVGNMSKSATLILSDMPPTALKLAKSVVNFGKDGIKKLPANPLTPEVSNGISTIVVAPSIMVLQYSLGTQASISNNLNSFADVGYTILGLFQGLLTSIGLRKRRRYWGTVYDSITKQPIDPAIVDLIDAASGKVLEQSITDLTGRFGFLDKRGKYYIRASKTHYNFPSKLVNGSHDSIFDNIYHGEIIEITKSDDLLIPNIPMDPGAFDWNQKEKQKIIKFHPKLEPVIQSLLSILLWSGFVFVLFNFISNYDNLLNLLFILLYTGLIMLRKFIPSQKLWGRVESGKINISGLLLEISPVNIPQVIVARAMTNGNGKFFLKTSRGDYILRIKKIDGSNLATVLESNISIGENGVLNKIINID